MNMQGNLLPLPLTAHSVRSYINFDGDAGINIEGSSQAVLQSKGVAAIWHLLGTKGYAYLADEVGMGKTRQALAVIATQFLSDPESHVVIICPGKTLQEQWAREWDTFIRTCYKGFDNRLVSAVDGHPLHTPHLHERLSDFAKALLLNESRIHLLRYSSFSRPIWFSLTTDSSDPPGVLEQYEMSLREIGIGAAAPEEAALVNQADTGKEDWRKDLTELLNEAYTKRIGELLKERQIDLITLDEAQYLRHVGNRQNTNLAHVFRMHVPKWQFLSATPLHSGKEDIRSLDVYLCRQPNGYNKGKSCATCDYTARCTQATYRMDQGAPDKMDVVDLLAEFMVRRPRSFKDGRNELHGKIRYRRYQRVAVSAAADPFLALTMALVQKRLVHALNGATNRFRQGECSSFESLAASVRRMRNDRNGYQERQSEIEGQSQTGGKVPDETPDRGIINDLNASFRAALLPPPRHTALGRNDFDPKYNLPHAKLNHVADALCAKNLHQGSLAKTLVFVRRLDTVDELVLLLLSRFQGEVDARIDAWRGVLSRPGPSVTLREPVWKNGTFWDSRAADDNDTLHDDGEADFASEDGSDKELSDRATMLPYFAALRRSSGRQNRNGMLSSFQSRLLASPERNPFDGFLLQRPAVVANTADVALWDKAEMHWEAMLELVMGISRAKASSKQCWMFFSGTHGGEQSWKLATLKRCILQSMRQSDFVVDLYILNRYIRKIPDTSSAPTLAEKLLWLLGGTGVAAMPAELHEYLNNWRTRLRLWFEHFELIVDKCLRKDGARKWEDIYKQVDSTFARMAPVMGRSGRNKDKNAVTQFNFPTHPNILVCTDVLKEGVDMHLFCDDIVHYGVAWTSGDLEQRIGRIDRFGSMISRRIGSYLGTDGDMLPRLNVEFPYLDGTLDRYQVERVMCAKIKSDLRMDLGKREGEIGTITIDANDTYATSALKGDASDTPQTMQHYPKITLVDVEGMAVATGRFAFARSLITPDPAIIHAPEFAAVIVRQASSAINQPLLRMTHYKTPGKKTVLRADEEYLVAMDDASTLPTAPLTSLTAALRAGPPLAITTLPHARTFRFDPIWNTLTRVIQIRNPFSPDIDRSQTVLLERLQGYLLLRTPVARVDDPSARPTGAEWESMIPTQNAQRSWGYLVIEDKTVWFVCVVLDTEQGQVNALVDKLAERVGKVGDRLQHLHCSGSDNEKWNYRSHIGIAALMPKPVRSTQSTSSHNKRTAFMTTNNEDLRECGRMLASAQEWLAEAFGTVLDALYGEGEEARGLTIQPITLRPSGVLHIGTEGRERFNIEAYLQLAPDDSAIGAMAAPRMIWQIAASSSGHGPKPRIAMYDWEEMPHVTPDCWDGDVRENGAVYHSKDDNRRYLILYHAPEKWDMARNELTAAWASVLGRMQSQNFQMKYAREPFLHALTSTC